jgi:VanZ family protein
LKRQPQGRARLFFEYWFPVILYAAAIVFLSAQPQLTSTIRFDNADKWAHLIEYAGLGFVLVRALRVSMPGRDPLTAAFAALALGALMAVCDEVFQSTVPGRDSSHLDFMADVAGLILAQLAYMAFLKE